ncbi:guanine-N(7)-methyltransferase domain-containing protein [Chytriomyces sp. MP71]|nr:guanine-N(7)-methyltransferase domain-containing protein [Chytriomyces sp. MP71]
MSHGHRNHSSAAAATVASHYNARPQVGIDARQESSILQLKNLHNWIKSVLIRRFARRGDSVLDFCCGKGGDLQKWIKADISNLIGADIANVSVQHAIERCRERNPRFNAKFYTMDCFVEPVESIVQPSSIDLVSCQFALHYCAENEQKFDRALDNIALALRPGGHFIATIPNCYRLIKKLEASPSLSFGNTKYNVRFETKDHPSIFGHKYWFQLEDAIDDCPEYVFHFPTFVRKAAERGLELVYEKPFHDLFNEEVMDAENRSLIYKMRVLDEQGTISADEWEVSGIYMAVALKKRKT